MLKLKKHHSHFIGLDVSTTHIKIAQVSFDDQSIKLENIFVIPIPAQAKGNNNDKGALFISETLMGLVGVSGNRAGLSIPLSACTEHRIDIEPDLTDVQIDELVRSRINTLSPYPLNNARYDYFVSRQANQRTLNISIVKKELLEEYIDTITPNPFNIVAATGGSFAFEKAIPVLFNAEQLARNIALFNIGYEETTVYLLNAGKLVYSRDADFGIADTVQAMMSFYSISHDEALAKLQQNNLDDAILQQTFMANLFSDLHQMLVREVKVFMMNSPDFTLDDLYLAGEYANLPRIIEYLNEQNRFHVMLFNPFANIPVAEHIDKSQLINQSPMLLDALIAALSIKKGGLNLMPWREMQAAMRKKQFMTGLLASAFAGFLVMGGLWGYQSNELKNQKAATDIIRNAITSDKEKTAQLGDIEAKKKLIAERLTIVSNLQDKRFELVKALNYFVMNFPERAYLTEMTKEGDNFTLRGRAQNSDVVVQMIRTLRFYPYFNNVIVTQWVADTANPDGRLPQNEIKSDGWGSFVITFTVSSTPHEGTPSTEVALPSSQITNPAVSGQVNPQQTNPNSPATTPNYQLAGLNANQSNLASVAGAATTQLLSNTPVKQIDSNGKTVTKSEAVAH